MAKQLQLRGGTTVAHSTFTGANKEITVDTDKQTLVVHDGATPGGNPLPTFIDLQALINDIAESETTTYSGAKIQALHNAQAEAIANLSGASGSISSSSSPAFNPIPTVSTILPFTVTSQSSNLDVFEFNDVSDTITFKFAGNYNFFSTIAILANSNATYSVTFDLVDISDDSVITTQTVVIDMQNGNTEIIPLNTLLVVNTAPLTIKVMVRVDTGTSLSFLSFSSILALAASVTTATVESLDTALGIIYEGLA